jgi:hypothetical protein
MLARNERIRRGEHADLLSAYRQVIDIGDTLIIEYAQRTSHDPFHERVDIMSSRLIRGFAWYTYPEFFGFDDAEVTNPGHPFALGATGEVKTPAEVVYFRATSAADTGTRNEIRAHSFWVLTKTQLRPLVSRGWDSDPAVLTDKFKTEDGTVRMVRVVELHHRHAGDLMECEFKVDEPVGACV